jgi:TPP-dependent pyruvate/acetoin dehydrogenase alpha subunit
MFMRNASDVRSRLELLREMKRVRSFELELYRQHDKKRIRGTLHICLGQEAVPVGVCAELQPGDFVTSTHRGHGHFLACGGSMDRMMAELFGRRDGYCQGKGGTQHLASLEHGFLGSNGITGGGIPYSTGIALAMKLRHPASVAVCFFGDGASNQGTFHESLNMAAIWKLPIVYVVENNGYAMSSRTSEMVASPTLAIRGMAYGIPGIEVDGNDVLGVRRTAREAIAGARAGKGPALIEAHTYRMSGHSRSDKCNYRTRDEEREWAARCPIERLRAALVADGVPEADLEAIDREVEVEVAAAVEFAGASGLLSREELLAGVYCS